MFLAAGAVGTTELLLRSRDVHKTLPDLSPRLGEGFSGNGDYLSLIRRTRIPLDPERGPTITTTSVVDFDEADGQVWFQVQDGAYPGVLSRLVGGFDPTRHLRERLRRAWPTRQSSAMTIPIASFPISSTRSPAAIAIPAAANCAASFVSGLR